MSRSALPLVLLIALLVAGCEAEYDPTLPSEDAMAVTPDTRSDATAQLTDREILEILYHATDGPNWTTSTNWLTDGPLEDWYGVATDEQGRVRVLRIFSYWADDPSGSIPPEIGGLDNLTRLNLSGSTFGSIPPELGDLSNLTSLYLSGPLGSIPPELGDLPNLTTYLSLRGYSSPIPSELGNLDKLTELSLRPDDPSDQIPTGVISDLAALTGLELRGYSSPIPSELGNLPNLERLRISNLTGPIPPEIGNLTKLTSLDLSGHLGLIPPEIGDLANLSNLYLRGATGLIPPELGKLTNLRHLTLENNELTGPIPSEIGKLTNLENLRLRDNDLSGPVPAGLGGLSELQYLVLSNNPQMAGALPADLTRIRWLQSLLTDGTNLCAPAEADFRKWLNRIETNRVKSCVEANPFAYLVQAVQSRAFPVPLVAGRKAMLRVFPTAKQETDANIPGVEAHFFHEGRKVLVTYIPGKPGPIPTEVDESSLAGSANAEIPGEFLQPGLEMVIEVDPDGTLAPELFVAKRIPETGRLPVEVHDVVPLDLTLIPFVSTENYDSSRVELVRAIAADPENHGTLRTTRTLLPISDIRVTAHEPVLTSNTDANSVLGEVRAVRALEWGEEGVRTRYYMGILPPGYTGNYAGLAQTSGKVSVSSASSSTIAHELGHNLSLRHAPCGKPGMVGWYPYSDGEIGAWGYDFRDGIVVPPFHKDMMSYCGPRWISDYHFTQALNHRPSTTIYAAAATKSVLLWGGIDADGAPHLEPAFLVDAPPMLPDAGGEYRISGRADGDGTELFSLTFDMPEVADGDGGSSFAFVLPWQDRWELGSITLSGPAGSFTLDGDTDTPMAILRDPRTGQVRGFLRDPPPTQAAADGRGSVNRASGLETLFSRGIPSGEAWQ